MDDREGGREPDCRQESEHDGPSRSGRGELHHATFPDEIFMRRPPPLAIQDLLFHPVPATEGTEEHSAEMRFHDKLALGNPAA